MTVAELVKALADCDPKAHVFVSLGNFKKVEEAWNHGTPPILQVKDDGALVHLRIFKL